ncbi:MAG: hypothetical protein WEB04_09410 [Dehalococcoidia bacterium]
MSNPLADMPAFEAILRAYGAQIAATQRQYANIQKVVNAQIRSITESREAMAQLVSQFANAQAVTRRTLEALRPAVEAIQRTLLTPEFLRQIQRSIEAWTQPERAAATILVARGWWLVPSFPVLLLNQVILLKAEKRSRSINRLICDYYSPRRLAGMMTAWEDEPLFKRRRHLFLEGLRAHREKRWYLSIPLLLTQVEGILADFAEQRNVPKKASVKEMARALRLDLTDTENLVIETWLMQLDAMFGSGFYVTEQRHRGVRRNAILHGRELRYGSEVKSTQLWLQLDTIYWLICATELPTPRVR